MTPLPTWLTIPTAGATAEISTAGLNMSALYVPNDLVPAQHLNYFLNGFSNNGNVSETALANVISELVTILTSASISPNGALTNQVLAALNVLFATVSSAANASNLATGTVPLARLSGITTSQISGSAAITGPQLSASAGIVSGQIANGTLTVSAMDTQSKVTSQQFTVAPGAQQLGALVTGETRTAWVRTNGLAGTILLPASGTYDYWLAGGLSGATPTDQKLATNVAGGATILSHTYGASALIVVEYTRR